LFEAGLVDALVKSKIDSYGPFAALDDDRVRGALPHAFDGVEAEADLAVDDGKVGHRLVHSGGSTSMPILVAGC